MPGEDHRLVARDTTSNHPAEALELPDVGYIRRLSPEGLLSVNPDLIIAQEGAGPPEAVALLQEAAVPMIEIPEGHDTEAVVAKITAVAEAHGVSPAQVLLAWNLALGNVVISKSVTPERIAANLASLELTLTDDEIAKIAALDKGSAGRQGPDPDTFAGHQGA